jgi:Mg2+ and Co2+ transporter CorA
MGSIVERKRKDGTVSYRAPILIKSKGRIVHQESSSFDRLTTTKAWLKRHDTELEAPDGLDAARRKTSPVGDAIDDFIKATCGDIGRTKAQVLRKIREEFAISDIPWALWQKPRSRYVDGSFGQLADLYLTHMHEQIAAKTLSSATVKQPSNLIGRILPRLQDGHLASLEASHIKALMKEFQKTPHQANNLLKTIRAMFRFAIDEYLMASDPSTGVKSNSKVTDGFACWTRDDVRTFYQSHPVGTKANLALTLLIATAYVRVKIARYFLNFSM